MRVRPRSWWKRLRAFSREQSELQERLALLNRPWEEDFLHWVGEGSARRLHGHLPPPPNGRRLSVTRDGWCPGLQRDRIAAVEASGATAIADDELC